MRYVKTLYWSQRGEAMSIIKYILFALVLLGLWVTEPLWRSSNTDTATTAPPENEPVAEQKKAKDEEVNREAKYFKELELKFGPKPSAKDSTGVPSSVYAYWHKTLQFPDSLQEETCGLIKGSDEGWRTVCRYKVKNRSGSLEIREDRFIIKNGTAYKR